MSRRIYIFAVGLAMISATRNYLSDLTDILFGTVLAITPEDLLLSAVAATIVLATVLILYWPLVLTSFDRVAAEAQGLPVWRIDIVFYGLLALAIVSGMIAVGTVLVTGLLIVPATTARLLTNRVSAHMVVSAVIGVAACWVGLYASYYLPIASGGAIVLSAGMLFAAVLFVVGARATAIRLRGRTTECRAVAGTASS